MTQCQGRTRAEHGERPEGAADRPNGPGAVQGEARDDRGHRKHDADEPLAVERERERGSGENGPPGVRSVAAAGGAVHGVDRDHDGERQERVGGEGQRDCQEEREERQDQAREQAGPKAGAPAHPERQEARGRQSGERGGQVLGEQVDSEQAIARGDDPERQRRLVEEVLVLPARHQVVAAGKHVNRRRRVHRLVAALQQEAVEPPQVEPGADESRGEGEKSSGEVQLLARLPGHRETV